MALNAGTIVAQLRADFASFKKEMREAVRGTQGLGDQFVKTSHGANVMATVMRRLETAVATIGFAKLAKDAISAADDFKDSAGRIQAAFGGMSAAATRWAANLSKDTGRARSDLQTMAADMQSILANASGSKSGSAGLSTSLTSAALDLAAARNIGDSDAFQAITMGIVGSDKELRKLGLGLDDTKLKLAALELGLGKTWEELTEGQQQMLRAQQILENLQEVQGEAAKSTDDLGESWKRLVGGFKGAAEMGTPIVDALTVVINKLSGFVNSVRENADVLKELWPVLLGPVGWVAGGIFGPQAAILAAATKDREPVGPRPMDPDVRMDRPLTAAHAAALNAGVDQRRADSIAAAQRLADEKQLKLQEMILKAKKQIADAAKTILAEEDRIAEFEMARADKRRENAAGRAEYDKSVRAGFAGQGVNFEAWEASMAKPGLGAGVRSGGAGSLLLDNAQLAGADTAAMGGLTAGAGQLGPVFSALATGGAAATAGISLMVSALMESQTVKAIMGRLNAIVTNVADSFGQLLEPLLPTVELLAGVVEPLGDLGAALLAVSPLMLGITIPLKLLAWPLGKLAEGVELLTDAVRDAVNWFLDLIGMDPLSEETPVHNATTGIVEHSNAVAAAFAGVVAQANKSAEKTKQLTEQLENVPHGFKVALARYNAIQPGLQFGTDTARDYVGAPILDDGGIVTGPTMARLAWNGRPEAVVPLDGAGRMGGSTYNTTIVTDNPLRMRREFERVIRRDHNAGGPRGPGPRFAGR